MDYNPDAEDWRKHLYLQTQSKALNGDSGIFRLLHLQPRRSTVPGVPPECISCFLQLSDLASTIPKLTAISHRWNGYDKDASRIIFVNSVPVPVAAELAGLLGELRQDEKVVTIWIDSLCINQEDPEEKAAQVSQLARIFAAAESTLMWLGSAADKSDEAMDVLQRIAEETLLKSPGISGMASWTSRFISSSSSKAEEKPDLESQVLNLRGAFKALLGREYWSRVWCLTELALSSKVDVMCGNRQMDIIRFHTAVNALDEKVNNSIITRWKASGRLDSTELADFLASPAVRMLKEQQFYRNSRRGWRKPTTEHALTFVMDRCLKDLDHQISFDATDPRDRVYGLLPLANDSLGILVDYSKDCDQLYIDTTKAMLRKSLRPLQLSQGISSRNKDFPSWAVDWRNVKNPPSDCLTNRDFYTCGPADRRFHWIYQSGKTPGVVAIRGVIVDTVQTVSNIPCLQEDDGDHGLASIKTLWGDSLGKEKPPYVQDQKATILSGMVDYMNAAQAMGGCVLFISDEGYIGIGPPGTISGDTIAIPYASHVPFVLRQQEEAEIYRLVGEVYVAGIMDGEFMKVHQKETIIRLS